MSSSEMNPKTDFFFNKDSQWQKEYALLRKIALSTGLTEELKWGCPCYTLQGKNIVLIHGFKEYCALLFMKGALLQDPDNILIQQTENVQAARQMRFTSAKQITGLSNSIKTYIYEAISVEEAGVKVTLKKSEEFSVPEEFQEKLNKLPKLKAAFDALTPGRQRAYLLHFSAAKQSTTRIARIEKYIPFIMEGKGLKD